MPAPILAHDWISTVGGAERVLDGMVEAFPEAHVWCLWNDAGLRYPGRVVRESWLAKTPLRTSKPAALPLMPWTWRHIGEVDAEWVLASSHLFAHHLAVRPETRKLAYVHTPARYIWCPEFDDRGNARAVKLSAPLLRHLDRIRAQETFALCANSEFVRSRIQSTWHRTADVIYPPAAVERVIEGYPWTGQLDSTDQSLLASLPSNYLLGASRLIPYKRLDRVIKAGEACDLPVVIAGSGPDAARLTQLADEARVPVTFVPQPSDALLYALYETATVFMFPGVEDFGIMPVEAMAAGTPVIVADSGGARESVVHGLTGAHLSAHASPQEIAEAVSTAVGCSPTACRDRSRAFGKERFVREIRSWVLQQLD